MIKTLMVIWATAVDDNGAIIASGMATQFVTQEECAYIKKQADAIDVMCLPMGTIEIAVKPKAKQEVVSAKVQVPIPIQKPIQKKKPLKRLLVTKDNK